MNFQLRTSKVNQIGINCPFDKSMYLHVVVECRPSIHIVEVVVFINKNIYHHFSV